MCKSVNNLIRLGYLTVVTCDTIPDTSGGYFNLTSSGTVTEVKFTCPEGTTINGDTVLACGSNGTWGVVVFPTCGKTS